MTSEEELKTMIKCFRVVDLQVLLTFAGRSKAGKKQELQARALELLQLKSQHVALKIRRLYYFMQKGYNNQKNSRRTLILDNQDLDNEPLPPEEGDDGGGLPDKSPDQSEIQGDEISIVDEGVSSNKESETRKEDSSNTEAKEEYQTCPVQPNSSMQFAINSMQLPIHPDVKFKKLPFYKVLYELLRPYTLAPQNYELQQRNSFIFYITPQQVSAICHSIETRPGCQKEFKVQGQLRFCLLETTSEQNDSFPPGLVVRVNNKFCYVQEAPVKKKKDVYVKEISPPINITPLMKLNASQGNKIEVQWNTEYGAAYVVAVYLVQKKTSEDLLNRLKAKGVRCADYTRGMIKDKLNEEADSEILTTSLRVSLMCPLGKMRLKTPCRASTCQHLQCFDASLYLQMNEKKATWMCPVCDSAAEYDQLVIDGYFQEILSSDKLPPDVNEIELHSDGSWSCHLSKPEDAGSGDGGVCVKVESDEILDVIIEDSKCEEGSQSRKRDESSKQKVGASESGRSIETEKRKVDEIDLTLSDSDDEPLIYYKRRESSKNKRNGVYQSNSNSNHSNSNSNRSSPSVINLDSDSSDSLPLLISSHFPLLPPLL